MSRCLDCGLYLERLGRVESVISYLAKQVAAADAVEPYEVPFVSSRQVLVDLRAALSSFPRPETEAEAYMEAWRGRELRQAHEPAFPERTEPPESRPFDPTRLDYGLDARPFESQIKKREPAERRQDA